MKDLKCVSGTLPWKMKFHKSEKDKRTAKEKKRYKGYTKEIQRGNKVETKEIPRKDTGKTQKLNESNWFGEIELKKRFWERPGQLENIFLIEIFFEFICRLRIKKDFRIASQLENLFRIDSG